MSIDLVSAIVSKALDGLFVRQTVTADNIANANSDGFTPARISFEDALRAAASPRHGDEPTRVSERVAGVTPTLDLAAMNRSEGVQLDQEIATASETSARYAMLTGMLDRTLQLQTLAIKGV
ncbi:flagellar basal body rod protein FlgB [Caballeronia telluris]|uniref:Flagellar basal body rod protein FlgB n=1 Tax=Caballeronia telluris TaxID=326475 RepID=A0A158ET06_9BURK|nr:flagellar basal body protein [Caballeronia telluris]SAL10718.1 flagellar basal body rod protein FlgB [Caballeronia telluris]